MRCRCLRLRRAAVACGCVEQAFGGELGLECLELEGQVAEAGRLERVDVELVDALRLEYVDAACATRRSPSGARTGSSADRRGRSCTDLGTLVLEREVAVAGGADADLADLALDPDVAQARRRTKCALHELCDLADAQDRMRVELLFDRLGAAPLISVPWRAE